MGTVGHAAQKYLHTLCAGHVSLEYAHKVTQKTGLDHHFIAGIQCIRVAYDVCFVHASMNLSNQFIVNRCNSDEASPRGTCVNKPNFLGSRNPGSAARGNRWPPAALVSGIYICPL
jgi:hypothetical protein